MRARLRARGSFRDPSPARSDISARNTRPVAGPKMVNGD